MAESTGKTNEQNNSAPSVEDMLFTLYTELKASRQELANISSVLSVMFKASQQQSMLLSSLQADLLQLRMANVASQQPPNFHANNPPQAPEVPQESVPWDERTTETPEDIFRGDKFRIQNR